jgi:two-component system, OmpR family, alkaline phosphatase synthesis response regulator PhoP
VLAPLYLDNRPSFPYTQDASNHYTPTAMSKSILIVDDEPDIIRMLKYNLEKEGFAVLMANDGLKALDVAAANLPDLIVLDVMMPKLDGWEVVRRLKRDEKTAHIPVIFLTAKASEMDEVVGLELGADDYIVKPISPRKLIARINSRLRLASTLAAAPEQDQVVKIHGIVINVPNYSVKIGNEEVFFPRKEFDVLVYLVRNRGRVMSRDMILDAVWGHDVHVVDRTIDVHIRGIREKLGKRGDVIETVKGVGYRFREDE